MVRRISKEIIDDLEPDVTDVVTERRVVSGGPAFGLGEQPCRAIVAVLIVLLIFGGVR